MTVSDLSNGWVLSCDSPSICISKSVNLSCSLVGLWSEDDGEGLRLSCQGLGRGLAAPTGSPAGKLNFVAGEESVLFESGRGELVPRGEKGGGGILKMSISTRSCLQFITVPVDKLSEEFRKLSLERLILFSSEESMDLDLRSRLSDLKSMSAWSSGSGEMGGEVVDEDRTRTQFGSIKVVGNSLSRKKSGLQQNRSGKRPLVWT